MTKLLRPLFFAAFFALVAFSVSPLLANHTYTAAPFVEKSGGSVSGFTASGTKLTFIGSASACHAWAASIDQK